MYKVTLQIVGLNLCQKTMGAGGRSRQVQPALDLAQVAEAACKLSGLLDQVRAHMNLYLGYRSTWPGTRRALDSPWATVSFLRTVGRSYDVKLINVPN